VPQSILVVEEDAVARTSLARCLGLHFRIKAVARPIEARALLVTYAFDLVIGSAGSRADEALDLCRYIRETSSLPFILLAECGDEVRRIAAFEAGIDDYVAKPFSFRELLAGARTMLRRAHSFPRRQPGSDAARYAFGDWVLHAGEHELLRADGLGISLSPGECSLFCWRWWNGRGRC
jgi:two-component system OmpR family response regulator